MAEEIEADNASWAEIQVTLLFTTASAAVFLTIFETSRKNPAVAAVFDRRRETMPDRTPPPLLRRIFEWVFLSTDPAYIDYSDMAHQKEVITERRRQQEQSLKFRSKRKDLTVPAVIEEEEMPKKKKKSKRSPSDGSKNRKQNKHVRAFADRDSVGSGDEQDSSSSSDSDSSFETETSKKKTLDLDNFVANPVNRRDNFGDKRQSSASSLSDKEDNELSFGSSSNLRSKSQARSHKSRSQSFGNSSTANISIGSRNSHHRQNSSSLIRPSPLLTPNVVEVNGRRLPAAIAEHAIAGDLSEDQLNAYEQSLIDQEKDAEMIFQRRRSELKRGRWRGLLKTNTTKGDIESQVKENDNEVFEDDASLSLASPPRRLWYFGFQKVGVMKKILTRNIPSNIDNSNDENFVTSPQRKLSRRSSFLNLRNKSMRTLVSKNRDAGDNVVNRHLKAASVIDKRPLSLEDQELLRCIGLDSFVMIRFLRFGFDCMFYPFLAACLFLIPTYYTNTYDGIVIDKEGALIQTETNGYFKITLSRLEPGSPRIWIVWGYGVILYTYILRRIWIEWETFIRLRFDFLANGYAQNEANDVKTKKKLSLVAQKDDVQLHLEQYRNSCIVEYIPESHRRDQELFQFFDAVFPGQVKRAEILLNATKLTNLIQERQNLIEKYEFLYARHHHAKQNYRKRTENIRDEDVGICQYMCCRCLGQAPKKPEVPKIAVKGSRKFCCYGKKIVKALPHLLAEIKRLNTEIEREHRRITSEKQKVEDKDIQNDLFVGAKKFVTGIGDELTCDTGFVEFRSLTAKQSALQCNVTGTTNYMTTTSAPDPRDMIWENATVEKETIYIKKIQCDGLLFTGTLFWSAVVTAVTSISNLDRLRQFLPAWLIPEPDTFWYGLIQGYLPVIFLELLMLVVPIVLRMIATKYIRFKANSEVDQFVFRWHFGFRVANLIIIIVKNQIYETLDALRTNPQSAIDTLSAGISLSSQFFLNNMIVATGTDNFFELAQIPKMVIHFLMHQYITVEAKSQRELERLGEPEGFEWGEVVPPFIFAFLVGLVYGAIVPLVMGSCAAFFYIATKVYTHQSLFVYAQPYEGGGKLMYELNRSVFTILYISATIFSILLRLKEAEIAGPAFFFLMNAVTFYVHRKVTKTFVQPSVTLALTHARIIDKENARQQERNRQYQEFKAKKLEKRKQATKAAKAEHKRQTDYLKDNKHESDQYLPSQLRSNNKNLGTDNLCETAGASNDIKSKIIFNLRKEEDTLQVHKRRAARLEKLKSSGSHHTRLKGSTDESDDSDSEKQDFYLYRQPHLNKSLWETKPRPYRNER